MASNLTITDARYIRDGIYPLLELKLNGRTARLISEPKPTLHNAGIVFLGGEFADMVPPIDFRVPDSNGDVVRLEGFTREARIFKLFDDFLTAINSDDFKLGPVPIPDEPIEATPEAE